MNDDQIRDRAIELFNMVVDRPYEEQIPALTEAARLCDEIGDERLGIPVRLALVSAQVFGGRVSESFVPFAWLVQRYDAGSAALNEGSRFAILWRHKWIVDNVTDFPQVPLEQAKSLLADMKRRFEEAGVGPEPYTKCLYEFVSSTQGEDEAEWLFESWAGLPRCQMSDCEVCSARTQAGHWASRGQYERALELLGPALRGEASCAEEPGCSLSRAALYAAELGRMEDAATYHLRGWREVRDAIGLTSNVATHLLLCARTGSLARGLELLAYRWEQVREYDNPLTHMYLLAAAARLVGDCLAEGMGGQRLHTRTGEELIIDESLHEDLVNRALAGAAAFDARNGNDLESRGIHERYLEAAPLPPMPLTVGVAGSRNTVEFDGVSQHPLSPSVEEIARAGAAELNPLVERYVRWGGHRARRAILARWRELRKEAIAQADAGGDPDFERQVAFAELNIRNFDPALTVAQDLEARENCLRILQACDEDSAAGIEYEMVMAITHDEKRAAELLARVRAAGSPMRILGVLSATPFDTSDPEACRARQAELLELGVTPDSPPQLRNSFGHLHLATASGAEETLAVCDEVETYFPDPDEFPSIRDHIAGNRVWALWDQERFDEAIAVSESNIAYLTRMGAVSTLTLALARRGSMSLRRQDDPTAEHYYQLALAAAQTSDRKNLAVDIRWDLADLMTRQGRTIEAIELIEACLADLVIPDDPRVDWDPRTMLRQRVGLLYDGAKLCETLGEGRRAISLARRGATDAKQLGQHDTAADLLGLIGDGLADSDPVESLKAYNEAIVEARADGDDIKVLGFQRHRMWPAADADGLDAGLTANAEAAETCRAVCERTLIDSEFRDRTNIDCEMTTLDVSIDRVRLLATHKLHDKALAELADAPEKILAHGNERFASTVYDLRARIRLSAADERGAFADINAGMDLADRMQDSQLRGRFAALGANWLDGEGRSDEAERFWTANNGQQDDD